VDERAQGIPELRSQVILEPFKGILVTLPTQKAEVKTASVERLSNKAEPFKWLFCFMG
jgi:hypothetical protein